MRAYPKTVNALLALSDVPIVAINQESILTYINNAFTKEYGWTEADLMGKSVTEIMPKHMRNAHTVGFARYLATETSELLGKPLPLSILYKDGRVRLSTHFILGDRINGKWRFAAIIDYPLENEN